MQLPDRVAAEWFERPSLLGLEGVLIDSDPIRSEGEPGPVVTHDDELVVVRAAISGAHLDGTGSYLLRRHDLEVGLRHPKKRDALTADRLLARATGDEAAGDENRRDSGPDQTSLDRTGVPGARHSFDIGPGTLCL